MGHSTPSHPPPCAGNQFGLENGASLNKRELEENASLAYDSKYYSSRRGRDDWFSDHWASVPGSKRQRSVRITEMWPAVEKRRQVRPLSPTTGRSDKRTKPVPEVSTDAVAQTSTALTRSDSPKHGNWSPEEDELLRSAVASTCKEVGAGSMRVPWSVISLAVPGRKSKQCRERFVEHLDVNIDLSPISGNETHFVYYLFGKHGRKWSRICEDLNRWRSRNGYQKLRVCSVIKNFVSSKSFLLENYDCVFEEPFPKPMPPVTTCTSTEFFEDLPPSPPLDPIVLEEFKDVLGLHATPSPDEEVESIYKEWEETMQGVEVADTTDGIARSLPNRNTIGYYDNHNNTPPRACCEGRKIRVQLHEGYEVSRRSLFDSINKMINTPKSADALCSPVVLAKRQATANLRKIRAAKLSAAVEASAKAWSTPLKEDG